MTLTTILCLRERPGKIFTPFLTFLPISVHTSSHFPGHPQDPIQATVPEKGTGAVPQTTGMVASETGAPVPHPRAEMFLCRVPSQSPLHSSSIPGFRTSRYNLLSRGTCSSHSSCNKALEFECVVSFHPTSKRMCTPTTGSVEQLGTSCERRL